MTCERNKIAQLYPELCVQLSHYQLIEVSGVDAETYLQGQLTCDVTKLGVGKQTLTCHCDPKGKVSSLFRLYRKSADQFLIIIAKSQLPFSLDQLKKYAVFSKVSFNLLDTPIFSTFSTTLAKSHPDCTLLEIAPQHYLLWGAEVATNSSDETLWDLAQLQLGIPLLSSASQNQHIPQALNLQCLDNAISFTKGCYIGQETVARAKYRGANKRAMFSLVGKLTAPIEIQIGQQVEQQLGENWKATGEILAGVEHQGQLWLQVVLNNEIEPSSQFRYQAVPLQIYAHPYAIVN